MEIPYVGFYCGRKESESGGNSAPGKNQGNCKFALFASLFTGYTEFVTGAKTLVP